MTGALLGSYRLLNKIGEGGMGAVYEAEHVLLGRRAAVKLLHSLYTTRPDIVHRFFNEARATSAIDHPSMVQIFDFGYHTDGTAFIVMELLRGQSLGARLARERRLPPEIAVGIARQIAGGLAAAHAHGIVHRDLKPDNLFLAPDREVAGGLRVKILDFGIAKLAQEAAAIEHRTRTGSLMGTPAYMAPEQCRGAGVVDGRADVYALGCILFEMVCGRPPFAGEGPGDVLVAQITLPPPPPSQFVQGLDPRLHAFIMKCLEKLPQARPRSMAEAEAELEKFYEPGRPISHPDHAMASWRSGPPVPVPTTLSSTTGQSLSTAPKPARKRGGLYVAVGVAAAMGVGGLVALLAMRPAPRSAVAPEPVAIADAAAALTVTAVDAADPARQAVAGRGELDAEVVAVPPDAAPARVELVPPPVSVRPPVARPERVEITIRSEPRGAEVVIDDRVWGRTPFRAAFERDKIPQSFVLRCGGYDEVQGTLSPSRRRHTVKLERQPDTPLGADCQ